MTTLRDLYKAALHEAATLRRRADKLRAATRAAPAWGSIDALRERAGEFESRADYLAHCIATFGDLDLAQIDIAELNRRTRNRTCSHTNPWARGVGIIAKAVALKSTEDSLGGRASQP